MGMIEKGTVKPVMILAPKRLSKFPDVPCTGELGLVLAYDRDEASPSNAALLTKLSVTSNMFLQRL